MQQATIFSPCDPYYSFRLGLLFVKAGYLQDAISALERAIQLKPGERTYHAVIADAYRECGSAERSEAHHRYAGQLDPYDSANLEVMRRSLDRI